MACPRCSECVGADHHWLPNPDFGDGPDPDWDGEGSKDPDYAFVCKHCPALGGECPECDGTGLVRVDDGDEDEGVGPGYDFTGPECGKCKGSGVVEGLAYTGWRDEG